MTDKILLHRIWSKRPQLVRIWLLKVLLQKVYEAHDRNSRDHIFMTDTKTIIGYIKDTHSSNDEKFSDFFSLVFPLSTTFYSLQYTHIGDLLFILQIWTTWCW